VFESSDLVPGVVGSTADNALETRNLALTSTFVVQGACTGVVFAIGDKTVMGRIVAMSGQDKFKLTTVQKEVWFFTKIISAVALSFFSISMIVWASWIRVDHPAFATASIAIINSIGCLTACVPQVSFCKRFLDLFFHSWYFLGPPRLRCFVADHHSETHG
jgi:sodium/potassium-transporting ATPase subunit alpha